MREVDKKNPKPPKASKPSSLLQYEGKFFGTGTSSGPEEEPQMPEQSMDSAPEG